MHTFTHMHAHMHTITYTHAHMHTFTHMRAHMHTFSQMRSFSHTCTHAHTLMGFVYFMLLFIYCLFRKLSSIYRNYPLCKIKGSYLFKSTAAIAANLASFLTFRSVNFKIVEDNERKQQLNTTKYF